MSAQCQPQTQQSAAVVVLADWRSADLERRRAILKEAVPIRMPSKYPGNDYNSFGHDLRYLAKTIKRGECKPTTLANLLVHLGTAADLICANVRQFESRAHVAERLLTQHDIQIPRQRKHRGPYKNRKPKR